MWSACTTPTAAPPQRRVVGALLCIVRKRRVSAFRPRSRATTERHLHGAGSSDASESVSHLISAGSRGRDLRCAPNGKVSAPSPRRAPSSKEPKICRSRRQHLVYSSVFSRYLETGFAVLHRGFDVLGISYPFSTKRRHLRTIARGVFAGSMSDIEMRRPTTPPPRDRPIRATRRMFFFATKYGYEEKGIQYLFPLKSRY